MIEEDKQLIQAKGKEAEAQCADTMTEDFNKLWIQFHGEKEERLEHVYQIVYSKYIPKLYWALRKGGTSIENSRTIVEGRCIMDRAIDTIRHHLPSESKDEVKSASGVKGNEVKKEMKEKSERKKEVARQEREALKKVEEQNE